MILEIRKGKHGKGKYCICKCDWCGKEFEKMESAFHKGEHQFCSNRCYGDWKSKNYIPWNLGKTGTHSKEHLEKLSELAKKRFTGVKQSPEHIKNRVASFMGYKHGEEIRKKMSDNRPDQSGAKNHNYGKHLSEETKRKISKATSGANNGNWSGGIHIHSRGYVLIRKPDHPNSPTDNYIGEHRLVMEKHLGRYLTEEEVVHHVNGVLGDNRIENLMLFVNNAEHIKYHKQLRIKQ